MSMNLPSQIRCASFPGTVGAFGLQTTLAGSFARVCVMVVAVGKELATLEVAAWGSDRASIAAKDAGEGIPLDPVRV